LVPLRPYSSIQRFQIELEVHAQRVCENHNRDTGRLLRWGKRLELRVGLPRSKPTRERKHQARRRRTLHQFCTALDDRTFLFDAQVERCHPATSAIGRAECKRRGDGQSPRCLVAEIPCRHRLLLGHLDALRASGQREPRGVRRERSVERAKGQSDVALARLRRTLGVDAHVERA
jgi:hypothetical protein